MKPFLFCPACAARLGPPDEDGEHLCSACGRTWYRNSAPTAGAAIVSHDRALVTCRAREPEKGRWDVPGGFLRPGEDPIVGLKRELREELDVEVDVGVDDCLSMAVHRYGGDGDEVLALGFRARLIAGDPTPQDDVADLRWVAIDDLDGIDFAWPHDRELVRRALTHERS